MNWLTEHLTQTLVVAGLLLLAIEVLVLGFATFFLFFIGLGLLLTGTLIYLGAIPETWLASVFTLSIITSGLALVLWQPLKRMQGKVEVKPVNSDLVGHTFILDNDISPTQPGIYKYSGITWRVSCAQAIPTGTKVVVTIANVGEFVVAPALQSS